MEVLFVFGGAVVFGFLLIVLIGATSPKVDDAGAQMSAEPSPLGELDSEQLGRIVGELLTKMGLDLERANPGDPGVMEIHARNPQPITGGTVLVHCFAPPRGARRVSAQRVGQFLSAVRSAYVSKGLLFTTGTFAADARLVADDAPIELFDGNDLERLVEQHLIASPQVRTKPT